MSKLPEPEKEFEAENNKEYKVKSIIDSMVYEKKAKNKLPGLYYLVLKKNYLEKKSTWEPSETVMYF